MRRHSAGRMPATATAGGGNGRRRTTSCSSCASWSGPALIPASEVEALQNGATIAQPDCNLYPVRATLFAVGAEGRAYLARKHLPADDMYVFAVVYTGPCSETVTYPDGHTATILDGTRQTTVFSPGHLRSDPVLGDIWFGDGGGTCEDVAGPPAAWCGR